MTAPDRPAGMTEAEILAADDAARREAFTACPACLKIGGHKRACPRNLKPGDPVRIVEHDDSTRQPRPGGEVLAALVIETTGLYVHVKLANGQRATFWGESGWHAWDGMFRWRLAGY